MKRSCNDGTLFVRDRDTVISVLCKKRNIQTKLKPSDAHRAAINNGDVDYFRRILDDAIAADIAKRDAHRKNKEEMKRIEEAQKRGIPVESAIVQPDRTKPPFRLVRIVPWYRRLWALVCRPFTPKVAVAQIEPPKTKSMGA